MAPAAGGGCDGGCVARREGARAVTRRLARAEWCPATPRRPRVEGVSHDHSWRSMGVAAGATRAESLSGAMDERLLERVGRDARRIIQSDSVAHFPLNCRLDLALLYWSVESRTDRMLLFISSAM